MQAAVVSLPRLTKSNQAGTSTTLIQVNADVQTPSQRDLSRPGSRTFLEENIALVSHMCGIVTECIALSRGAQFGICRRECAAAFLQNQAFLNIKTRSLHSVRARGVC